MEPVHIRNIGGDKNEQIINTVDSIGRSNPRLEVFLAVCKGKKKEKSVSWIRENTSLKNNKRVTEEAKKLVKFSKNLIFQKSGPYALRCVLRR